MKLLLFVYYSIRESILGASQALKKHNWEIVGYPLLEDNTYESINKAILKEDPKVLLFWCFKISPEVLRRLKESHRNRVFSLFNWDDPYCWSDKGRQMEENAKYMDLVYSTCQESCSWYKEKGVKEALFLLPGFDPQTHRPIVDPKYKCDISFCLTNLYENPEVFPDQLISRKDLIEKLIKEKDISFRLYGPEFLGQLYPNHYHGFVIYDNLSLVYHNSKINICTHGICKYKYANERSILVTGAKGLLYVDPVHKFETIFNKDECLFIDLQDPITQIRSILKNYHRYEELINNGYQKALQDYTWDKWAETINDNLCSYIKDRYH